MRNGVPSKMAYVTQNETSFGTHRHTSRHCWIEWRPIAFVSGDIGRVTFARHKKTAVGGAVDLRQRNWRFRWLFAESADETIINYEFGFAQWFTQQFIVNHRSSLGVCTNHRSHANASVVRANGSNGSTKSRLGGQLRQDEHLLCQILERHCGASSSALSITASLFQKSAKALFSVRGFEVLRISKGMEGPGPFCRVWKTRRIWEGR